MIYHVRVVTDPAPFVGEEGWHFVEAESPEAALEPIKEKAMADTRFPATYYVAIHEPTPAHAKLLDWHNPNSPWFQKLQAEKAAAEAQRK